MNDDLQAFFQWQEENDDRLRQWLQQVAEEDQSFWADVMSVPSSGGTA